MKFALSGKRTGVLIAVGAGVLVLYVMGAEERREQGRDDADPAADTNECRIASTVDGLNVRSAPALDPANVVDQLTRGEEVDADEVVQNGFRKIADDRWVSVEYIQVLDGRDCG